MKRNIEAMKRAEIKMSQMSGKAKEYYNNTQDGSWVEEYNDEFIIKYGNGEEEKYSNLKEMDEAFSALYDDVTVEIIADEIVKGNKAQAKMIVDMYNQLYGNEPVDINICVLHRVRYVYTGKGSGLVKATCSDFANINRDCNLR